MEEQLDLQVNIGRTTLRNPIILASGPLGYKPSILRRFAEAGFGAITSKTLTPVPWPGNPHLTVVDVHEAYILNSDGLRNPGFQAFVEEIKVAKMDGVPLIVSITAADIDEWISGAKLMEKSGADVVQLNTGCAHISPETRWGAYWSRSPERLARLVGTLKKEVSVPIWTKTRHVRVAEEAGADANVITGLFSGMLIDVDTGRPRLGALQFPGTVSGPAAKPAGILNVVNAARSVKIPLIGSGGITTGLDVLEYLMAGACAVEVYCVAMRKGPTTVRTMIDEIKNYLNRKRDLGVKELIGKSLKHIPQLEWTGETQQSF